MNHNTYIQLIRERLSEKCACGNPGREVNMGYNQYSVSDTSCRTYSVFPLALKHTSSPPAILSNFFEKQLTQNHPQYLSGLCRVDFFSHNLSRKSCVDRLATQHGSNKLDHDFKRTSFLVVFYYILLGISIKSVLRKIHFYVIC